MDGSILEVAIAGYLAASLVSAGLLWLSQRRGGADANPEQRADNPSLLTALLVAGLAWPVSLPLAAYGWLKELRAGRSAR